MCVSSMFPGSDQAGRAEHGPQRQQIAFHGAQHLRARQGDLVLPAPAPPLGYSAWISTGPWKLISFITWATIGKSTMPMPSGTCTRPPRIFRPPPPRGSGAARGRCARHGHPQRRSRRGARPPAPVHHRADRRPAAPSRAPPDRRGHQGHREPATAAAAIQLFRRAGEDATFGHIRFSL